MIIAPSVLSFHFDKFKEEIDILNKKAEFLHFDVMDGHFVPNLTFGPDVLKAFRRSSNLFMDVHLMVEDPDYFSDIFIKAGADGITFHYESFDDIIKCDLLIDKIHKKYIKAGISVRPNTDIEVIKPLLDKIDIVLVMSVEPGFGGQEFIQSTYDKLQFLDQYRKEHDLKYLIEVDGGVNDKNAHEIIQSGTDILVAGSYVFKGDINNNLDTLRKCK
ncbi:MAG: ribulose-phosphate 3-epimerase [Erysipelotrichaceae bacterium]|nr:ribulose-phosphate 3-epimerase [Erysipelotrichaceae bacterium]